MTEEEKIICKQFLNDADKTHSCNEYKLLMALLEQEPTKNDLGVDYVSRTICPKGHIDVDSPYWRIPDNRVNIAPIVVKKLR